MPVPRVGYPYITAPFATFPTSCPVVLVRLACLIHAANVRSEPGSNPSKKLAFPEGKPPGHVPRPAAKEPVGVGKQATEEFEVA